MKLLTGIFLSVVGIIGAWIVSRDGWVDPRLALTLFIICLLGFIGGVVLIMRNK